MQRIFKYGETENIAVIVRIKSY